MKKDPLLDVLEQEWLLAKARALGAEEAYHLVAVGAALVACSNRGIRTGHKIELDDGSNRQLCIFDKMEWREYDFVDYKGPSLIGRSILKSGKPGKRRYPLCSIRDVENGLVKPADKGARP